VTKVTGQFTYNERGQLLAETDRAGNVIAHAYDTQGREIEQKKNGKSYTQTKFDSKGRPSFEILPSGEKVSSTYNANGTIERLTDSPNGVKLVETWKDEKKIAGSIPGVGNEKYGYDKAGVLNRIEDANGDVWDLRYSAAGEVVEKYKNGLLDTRIFTDASNLERIRVRYSGDGLPCEAWDWKRGKYYWNDVARILAEFKWIEIARK
jgi:YD repeat-containing protein